MLPTNNQPHEAAVRLAAKIVQSKPVYIDTETTGLDRSDEIVEISIIDFDGSILLSSLVKPSQSIPADVQRIHGITNEMISSSPAWPVLWPKVRNLIYGRPVAAYNAPFDLRMMQQSHARYRIPWRENLNMIDVLPIFSNYQGVWDPIRRSMKYHKLEEAGRILKISLPNAHRSSADALLTRAVLHCMAGISYE